MNTRLVPAVIILVMAGLACGPTGSTPSAPSPTGTPIVIAPTASPTADPLAGWLTYTNADCSFQVRVPPGSIITPGTDSDVIGLPFAAGTNLVEKYLEVTCRAGVVPCQSPFAEGWAPGQFPSEVRDFNGTAFTVVSAGEGAAGNFYNWTAYSTASGGLCIDLSFVLHSVNAYNYDPPIPEYDVAVESAIFDEIMSTFTW